MSARGLSTILLAVVLAVLVAGPAFGAEKWSRVGKSEVFVFAGYMGDDTTGVYRKAYTDLKPKGVIEAEVTESFNGGIGYGKTLHKHLNINCRLGYGRMDFTAKGSEPDSFTLIPSKRRVREVTAKTDVITAGINVEAYLLEDSFPYTNLKITPMVTGGIGVSYLNGDFEDAGDLAITEFDFTTNVGVGFRWDIADHFLFKALYTSTWLLPDDTTNAYQLMGGQATFGYEF